MRNFCLTLTLCVLIGCNSSPSGKPAAKTSEGGAAASGHSHDANDLGPHGGHLLHLEPTGDHAEWTHDDESHKITVYPEMIGEVEKVQFVVAIPNADTETFELTKEGDGWTISSEALLTHLNMGETVNVKLVVTPVGGESLSAAIEHQDHEHHH